MTQQELDNAISEAYSDFAELKKTLGPDVSQLWSDALKLIRSSEPQKLNPTERRQRLARAAVFTAAAAFEAVTNYLSEQLVRMGEVGARKLSDTQIDCLREKKKVRNDGKIEERDQFYSAKDRFLLLFNILSGGKNLGVKSKGNLTDAVKTRNKLVHPKPGSSVDVLQNHVGAKAVFQFLWADMELAQIWAASRNQPVRPRGGFEALRLPTQRVHN